MSDVADPRDLVIRAADQLFNAHGVHSVGMDKVRDAAGVSLKKIYSMFPSKEALILAVLDDRSRQWAAGVASCTEGLQAPRDKLLAIFDFLLRWFGTDEFRGCAFINAYGELGAEMPSVAEAVRAQKVEFQEYVAALVAELDGPPSLASQLAILAEGAQTTAAIAGTAQAAEDARAAAEALIDHALA